MDEAKLGGRFTFPGTSLTVHRIGYGAMQLAGPGVWGPPKDPDGAVAVLREAVAAGGGIALLLDRTRPRAGVLQRTSFNI